MSSDSIIYKLTKAVIMKDPIIRFGATGALYGGNPVISAPPDYVDGKPFEVSSVESVAGRIVVHVVNLELHPLPRFNVSYHEPPKYSRRGDEQ